MWQSIEMSVNGTTVARYIQFVSPLVSSLLTIDDAPLDDGASIRGDVLAVGT